MNNNTRTYHSHSVPVIEDNNRHDRLANQVLAHMPRSRKGKLVRKMRKGAHN